MVGVIILENNKIIFFIFYRLLNVAVAPRDMKGYHVKNVAMGILGLTILFIKVNYIIHLGIWVY